MSTKAAAALAAGTLLLGLITGNALANNSGNHDQPAPVTATKKHQLVISDRTKQGAITAAARYADAFGQAVLGKEAQGRDIVEAIGGEGIREELLERLQEGRKAFGEAAQAGGVLGRGAPLGYRVKSYSQHAARVEVWSVGMASAPEGNAALVALGDFITTTVDLTWERGAWRLAGEPDGEDGPAPTIKTAASSAEMLHVQIKGFREFSHVAP